MNNKTLIIGLRYLMLRSRERREYPIGKADDPKPWCFVTWLTQSQFAGAARAMQYMPPDEDSNSPASWAAEAKQQTEERI